MATALKPLAKIRGYLEERRERIQGMIPKGSGLTADRLNRLTLMAVGDSPSLMRCSAESVVKSVMQAARYGLEIGGPLPQAYLVAYNTEATLIVGYRGLLSLVLRSGSVKEVGVEFVYQGDTFERQLGIGGKFKHVASNAQDRESHPVTHVYSEFLLPTGNIKHWVMTADEINRHAQQFSPSCNKKDSAWQTSWKAMAAKTVLRQPILRGLLPINLTADEREAFGDQGPLDMIEVEPVSRTETTRVQPDETLATETELLTDAEMEAALERESIQSE